MPKECLGLSMPVLKEAGIIFYLSELDMRREDLRLICIEVSEDNFRSHLNTLLIVLSRVEPLLIFVDD